MDLQLQGKTALVTGSDKRTGETIAETLEREGATVVFHGLDERPDRPLSVQGDITSETGCEQVLAAVADLVVFLCSPRADFINGQNLRIDGGAH